METAKATLNDIYVNEFNDCIKRQRNRTPKQGSHSADRTTISSNSEIMLEPDSAIARKLKEIHTELEKKSVSWPSRHNSERSSNLDDLETDFSTEREGEHSEVDIPSSTRVNADPESAKTRPTMDSIEPERQELIARYLKDVNRNSVCQQDKSILKRNAAKGSNGRYIEKGKLAISDSIEKTYFHKNTKHIPAILRKKRSLVDCVAKEEIRLSIEKHPNPGKMPNKPSMQNHTADHNLREEHTPDCGSAGSSQLIEAPKCKYVHMNAKYNQPLRIQGPSMQNKCSQKNNHVSERHLFSSPKNFENNFVLNPHYAISPIKQQLFVPEYEHNIHSCPLSRENSQLESNCMVSMSSYDGDIRELTGRLTLASQSQKCSQDSMEQTRSSQEKRGNSQPSFFYPERESSNMSYNNQPAHVTFNDMPESEASSMASSSNFNFHLHVNPIKCGGDKPAFISNNDFQVRPSNHHENYAFQQSFEDYSCCAMDDCQAYRKRNTERHPEPMMNGVAVQQQRVSQPVKYVAIEGSRMPQRRPIFSTNEGNSRLHTRKTSIPNQHFVQMLKPYNSRDASGHQPRYSVSTMPATQYHEQGVPQSLDGPDVQSNMSAPSMPRSMSFNGSDNSRLGRNQVHFVPNNMSSQTFVAQESMPVHVVNHQRHVRPKMQMQMPAVMYSQAEYQYRHRNNNNNEVKLLLCFFSLDKKLI